MDIFPAIDLQLGKVVRLRQGNPNLQMIYSDAPALTARRWAEQGARWLHVVNLDGALSEGVEQGTESKNIAALREILQAVKIPLQFGGGLRDVQSIENVLQMGVSRVVLGTAAVQQPEVVREAIQRFGAGRIVVGLDAKSGRVATHGWQTQSTVGVEAAALQMKEMGVTRVVFTDIARDGMLQGVNAQATCSLARASGLRVIASGGVSSLDDIRRLKACEADGVEGVIIGQALYLGAVDLREAIKLGDAA